MCIHGDYVQILEEACKYIGDVQIDLKFFDDLKDNETDFITGGLHRWSIEDWEKVI